MWHLTVAAFLIRHWITKQYEEPKGQLGRVHRVKELVTSVPSHDTFVGLILRKLTIRITSTIPSVSS